MKREFRAFEVKNLEIRAEEGKPKRIVGHAAVFDILSEPMYGFREKVAKGAFLETIAADDVRALFNHDPNFILGRNRAGTLTMAEDDQGLAVEIMPPDTQSARDLLVSIERRDISQMSFGFETLKEEWNEEDPQNVIRTLVKVRLYDVSPVTYAAYSATSVNARSAEDIIAEHRAAKIQADDAALLEKRRRDGQAADTVEREITLLEKEYA